MSTGASIPEPSRSTEVARLELARIAEDATLEDVFARACELSSNALEVERVGVWLFIDNATVLRCANLYERSKGEHSSGTLLRVADFPTYFSSLSIRKALPAEVVATEPWAAELAEAYLKPLGISSLLDAGIFIDGNLVGVVCHEHVGQPREWTTEARDFAGSVADLVAMRIQSAKVRELEAAFQTQEQRLADQDKIDALSRLAAGVAHDFRNLLTVFLGTGESLSRRGDVPEDVRSEARTIVAAAERGICLANELTEFASPDERPPTVIDLAAATSEFLPILGRIIGSRHQLRFHSFAAVGQVLIDKTQYTRLLLNLVVNAQESMPRGGTVQIKLTPVCMIGIKNTAGPFVLLQVSDHGTGMDEVTRQRAFEPFFTTKLKGTGLGLAIVRQIIERAGGFVRVESPASGGTIFQVFFPRIGTQSGGNFEHTSSEQPGDSEADVRKPR